MLPAFMLLLLPLRFKLEVLLTEFFFFRVPLREGVPTFEALEAERWMPVASSPARIELSRWPAPCS